MEFAKSELEVLKEIAPEQVAMYRHGADRSIEGEGSELRMREFEAVNSRADGEARCGVQSHLSSSH